VETLVSRNVVDNLIKMAHPARAYTRWQRCMIVGGGGEGVVCAPVWGGGGGGSSGGSATTRKGAAMGRRGGGAEAVCSWTRRRGERSITTRNIRGTFRNLSSQGDGGTFW
jgi:hypothetical protein